MLESRFYKSSSICISISSLSSFTYSNAKSAKYGRPFGDENMLSLDNARSLFIPPISKEKIELRKESVLTVDGIVKSWH
jgi:hypothetical protein